MDFGTVLRNLSTGDGAIAAIINMAADLTLVLDSLFIIFKIIGALVFIWGVWHLCTFKKPNANTMGGAVTAGGISLKLIFGSVIYQFTFWMEQLTQSVWSNASPAMPLGYVEMAKANTDVNPIGAALLAVLAILTIIGWITSFAALYGFSSLGDVQDKHAAIWKNIWKLAGGLILINSMLFASDVAASFLNLSGPVFTTDSFFK